MSIWIGINNSRDLQNIKDDLSAKYKLIRDIDMSGFNFDTIQEKFTGILDGQGYSIKNLKVLNNIQSGTNNTGGMFLQVSGTIKKIHFQNPEITGEHCVSVICGNLIENGIIENVTVDELNINAGSAFGGIAGVIRDDSIIKECNINGGDLQGYGYSCGGIAAAMEGDSRIIDCSFSGTINPGGSTGLIVGKISSRNSIERCLGILHSGSVSGLWNSSTSSGSTDSFYDSILLPGDKNGIGKTTEELQKTITYLDKAWDSSVWRIVPGRYAEMQLKLKTEEVIGFVLECHF